MRLLTTLIVVFISFSLLVGQKKNNTLKKAMNVPSPNATLDQVSWIAGHWKGEAFGGQTEEIWTPPSGGSMMGAFKLFQGDKVSFYEICVIRQQGESLILQLRHFHNDLKAWEEKDETVDFPLVRMEKDEVYFDQFTFRKIDDDEMHIYVVIDDGDKSEEVQFIYNRMND